MLFYQKVVKIYLYHRKKEYINENDCIFYNCINY